MTRRYSLSAHLFAYEPLDFGHLRVTAEAGFRRTELWAMTPHFDVGDPATLTRLREWLRDLGIAVESFHAPFYAHLDEARAGRWLSLAHPDEAIRRDSLHRVERAMEALSALGARIAVIHPAAPGSAGVTDSAENLFSSIEMLLPLAERLDLTLAVENIPAPLGRANSVTGIVEEVGHPRLRACIDTGHAFLTEGAGIEAAFRRLAPLAAATHIHDNDGEKDLHAVPGEAAIPWHAFWKSLDEVGYAGPATFEIRSPGRVGPYDATLAALAAAAGISDQATPPKPRAAS